LMEIMTGGTPAFIFILEKHGFWVRMPKQGLLHLGVVIFIAVCVSN
jgi:hypothetical protein